MAKKNIYKNYNLADEIYYRIRKDFTIDIGADGPDIDITETSANLDIQFTTQQTHSENIYFDITIYDYNKKTELKAGYIYIKHNRGMIDEKAMQVLYKAIQAANKITAEIFDKLY